MVPPTRPSAAASLVSGTTRPVYPSRGRLSWGQKLGGREPTLHPAYIPICPSAATTLVPAGAQENKRCLRRADNRDGSEAHARRRAQGGGQGPDRPPPHLRQDASRTAVVAREHRGSGSEPGPELQPAHEPRANAFSPSSRLMLELMLNAGLGKPSRDTRRAQPATPLGSTRRTPRARDRRG